MNYYRRYLGDYMRDTMHLSILEHGAYTLLLDAYYASEKPLPAEYEALYRICRAMSAHERDAVKSVADRFFPIKDGVRRNPRADREITVAQATIEKQRKSGVESSIKRWGTHAATDGSTHKSAIQPPTTNHHPSTTNPQPPEKKARKRAASPLPEGFEISERVTAWAAEKAFGDLGRYHEFFIGRMRASGKAYADWDQAFMNCIREDWPGFRKNGTGAIDMAAFVKRLEEEERQRAGD